MRDRGVFLLIRALILPFNPSIARWLLFICENLLSPDLKGNTCAFIQLRFYLDATLGIFTDSAANVKTLPQSLQTFELIWDLLRFAKRVQQLLLVTFANPYSLITDNDLDKSHFIANFSFGFYSENLRLLSGKSGCIFDEINQDLGETKPVVINLHVLSKLTDLKLQVCWIVRQFFFIERKHCFYVLKHVTWCALQTHEAIW